MQSEHDDSGSADRLGSTRNILDRDVLRAIFRFVAYEFHDLADVWTREAAAHDEQGAGEEAEVMRACAHDVLESSDRFYNLTVLLDRRPFPKSNLGGRKGRRKRATRQ